MRQQVFGILVLGRSLALGFGPELLNGDVAGVGRKLLLFVVRHGDFGLMGPVCRADDVLAKDEDPDEFKDEVEKLSIETKQEKLENKYHILHQGSANVIVLTEHLQRHLVSFIKSFLIRLRVNAVARN